MGYAASDRIRIFPSSSRTQNGKIGTNWVTEYNLSSIVNKLLGCSGFVITPTSTDTLLGSYNPETGDCTYKITPKSTPFEFNINGYFVKIDSVEDIKTAIDAEDVAGKCSNIRFFRGSSDKKGVYAQVFPTGGSTDVSFTYLDGGDGAKAPAGVSSESSNNTLLLFRTVKEDSTDDFTSITIPQSSRIHFSHLMGVNMENFINTVLDGSKIVGPTGVTVGPTGAIHFSKGAKITGDINNEANINLGPTGAITLTNSVIKGSASATGATIAGGTFNNPTISQPNISGGNINGTKLYGVTVGPTGAIQSTFAGQLVAPTGTLSTVHVTQSLGPTGSATVTATEITNGGVTITASTSHPEDSDSNNLARLFRFDDGEL